MNNIISRLLDRLNATQRTRQIFINVGLFLLSAIAFYTANPIYELSDSMVKWVSVLAFMGNALAGMSAIPKRSIPMGYKLVEVEPETYVIQKQRNDNWLFMLMNSLRATDQLKTILVNVGLLVGAIIALFISEGILPESLPQWIASIGFAGNALAGMLNRPERSVPEGYNLFQREDGSYFIAPENGLRNFLSADLNRAVKVEF